MKIVTAAEMREIDRATSQRFGVPSLTLMENAGTAVAEFVVPNTRLQARIGVICGKGNNGGDGFVAARKLKAAGREVRVVLLAEPSELRGDAAEMFSKLPIAPIIVPSSEELKREQARAVFESEVLLDAILGTGFKPPVSGLYAEAIRLLNASSAPVVAVDIPSGADADVMGEQTGAVARADAVVTFTAPRPAHIFGRLTDGPTLISPIGSPDEAVVSSLQLNLITAREIAPLMGPRPLAANKGNFGHVLVIGGSFGKAGAAAMAGMAALRSGAGLSTVATPKSVLATVAGFHPEVMTEPLDETDAGSISTRSNERVDTLIKGKTVLAVGPGISRNPETSEFVRRLVVNCKTPIVLDADGLNAFEGRATELNGKGRSLVITPHPGEMARLAASTIARSTAGSHQRRSHLRPRTRTDRGAERASHADRAARRHGLGEHHRQSRHGNRRHGRHPHRHGRRFDRAKSSAHRGSSHCCRSSPRSCRRRGPRKHGRTFAGRNRPGESLARGIPPGAGVCSKFFRGNSGVTHFFVE